MTNEDYIQWEPLLKKIAYKYRNNIFGLDIDDLIQIGAIGLMYAFNTYEDGRASKKTYFYNCIEWKIFREFDDLKRAKRFCLDKVSLDTPISDEEDTFIGDIIPDDKINIEELALDTATIKEYIDEINRILKGNEREVILYRLFDNLTNNEIAIVLNIESGKVQNVYSKARRNLIRKSTLFRIKWLEFHFNSLTNKSNTEKAAIYLAEIEGLKRKYIEDKKKLVK